MNNKTDIEEDIYYKNTYLGKPISLLTTENLKELEEHCKRQIQRYETGKREKEEHLLILELLYTYNQNEIKANAYDTLVEKIKEEIQELKKQCGGNVFHIQQTINAEIRLLQKLLDTIK